MNRFAYILNTVDTSKTTKIVGIFPFGTLIENSSTDIHDGKINFIDSAVDGLATLARKNYSVVAFINQFKSRPISYEHFNALNQAVESFVKSQGVNLLGIYWCPSTDKNDPFVVPNPGMFNKVTENLGIVWDQVPVISASSVDLSAASKVKAIPVKIGTGSEYLLFADWVKSLNH